MDACEMARTAVRAARAASSIYYHGLSTSLFKGRGLEYVDFREYAPGDELGRIDWRLTARSPGESGYRLMVREYEEEHIRRVTLAVALYDSVYYKRKPYMLAYTATLLARAAERLGDEINLVTLAGEEPRRKLLRPPTLPHQVAREVCKGPRGGDPDRLVSQLPGLAMGTPLALIVDYNIDPATLRQALRRATLTSGNMLVTLVYAREEVSPPPVDGLATMTPGTGGAYGRISEIYKEIRIHIARVETAARRAVLVKASTPNPSLARRILDAYIRLRIRRAASH